MVREIGDVPHADVGWMIVQLLDLLDGETPLVHEERDRPAVIRRNAVCEGAQPRKVRGIARDGKGARHL